MAYGLAQCTPQLTPADCSNCLEVLRSIHTLTRHSGGWFATTWCSYQFHMYKFFPTSRCSTFPVTSNTPRGMVIEACVSRIKGVPPLTRSTYADDMVMYCPFN